MECDALDALLAQLHVFKSTGRAERRHERTGLHLPPRCLDDVFYLNKAVRCMMWVPATARVCYAAETLLLNILEPLERFDSVMYVSVD